MRDRAKSRNGRNGHSGEAYHANAGIPTRYASLMQRLIENSKSGTETSASECAEVGGLQYQTRIHEGRKQGWPIITAWKKAAGKFGASIASTSTLSA